VRRTYRNPTKAELATITSKRPVLRRVRATDDSEAVLNPSRRRERSTTSSNSDAIDNTRRTGNGAVNTKGTGAYESTNQGGEK
jgi:hypothetical protein